MANEKPLVNVKRLSIGFTVEEKYIEAVDGISFAIGSCESVGLVGESGCGKSVTAMALIKLLPVPVSRIACETLEFAGKDLLSLPHAEIEAIRGREVGVIFQEPMTSLNPVKKIGVQVEEPLRIHLPAMEKTERRLRMFEMLAEVGLSDAERVAASFPHNLSGGMRQRVMIAIAMVLKPKLLIADEPTTALDVTIQAQIIDLIKRLQEQYRMSLLLISHNMGLVTTVCERVFVMYAGRLAETSPLEELFSHPLHPYTQGLLKSIPTLSTGREALQSISGTVPHPSEFLPGCRFAPRCPYAFDLCRAPEPPPLFVRGPEHGVSCWLYREGDRPT
ncbi:MAG: ABC transporter ATP-binding protein [Spirochaetales bacterium]|nr:ABC transporter ATP-binding protein [Spirochaetales bacterium]